ncbi:MAG: hypothetical protein WCT08_04975 [Patescibacteria group bacterium]|jgi:hypothetical protein
MSKPENGWHVKALHLSESRRYSIPDSIISEIILKPNKRITFTPPGQNESITLTWEIKNMRRGYVDKYDSFIDTIGCTITTAVLLSCSDQLYSISSHDLLETLRQYRRTWLEGFGFGKRLSNWYERWSPPVADWLADNKKVSLFLLKVFIRPCFCVLQERERWPKCQWLFNIGVMGWYVVAGLVAKICYLSRRRR